MVQSVRASNKQECINELVLLRNILLQAQNEDLETEQEALCGH